MQDILRIFIGYDNRQAVSYNVLQSSIIEKSSKPVSITPLHISQLSLKRQGLTPFTWSRFLVPYLCDYHRPALFLDADIVLSGDISQLFDFASDNAVYVRKGGHKFEWASVMLFNCGHEDNKRLTPEYIETTQDPLHQISWTESIGELPAEWNHLVGYDKPSAAKLIHYTQGIPAFPETNTCEHADLWLKEKDAMNHSITWAGLMANSVHAININNRPVPRYLFDVDANKPTAGNEEKLRELLT